MIRRVLMTADTVGGVWTYSLDLARGLAARGIEVSLATMGRALTDDQWDQARAIPGLQVYESEFKLEWMDDPWSDIKRAARWLLTLQDAISPDIVHLNGYCHAGLRWSAPTVVVCHSDVLSWWQAVRGSAAPEEWSRYAAEVQRGLRAAKLVVAPTRAMLNEADRLYGPFQRSLVIPNAREASDFFAGDKEAFVFSAGRFWDEAKNIQALDAVASGLPWPVYVAGDEVSTSNSKLRRLGRLPATEIVQWLSRASIYALPARYEPFGLSILEAALSGCALVLGDIPSLRENWSDCALFVDPENPEMLREAIQRLIDHPELRRSMGEAAQRRGHCFGVQEFTQLYVDAYEELREARRARRMSLALGEKAFIA